MFLANFHMIYDETIAKEAVRLVINVIILQKFHEILYRDAHNHRVAQGFYRHGRGHLFDGFLQHNPHEIHCVSMVALGKLINLKLLTFVVRNNGHQATFFEHEKLIWYLSLSNHHL
jgi:hypothetical protein